MKGFIPKYSSSTLENISVCVCVLLNILWMKSLKQELELQAVFWQDTTLLIGFNFVPTMTLLEKMFETMDVSSQLSVSAFIILTQQL